MYDMNFEKLKIIIKKLVNNTFKYLYQKVSKLEKDI